MLCVSVVMYCVVVCYCGCVVSPGVCVWRLHVSAWCFVVDRVMLCFNCVCVWLGMCVLLCWCLVCDLLCDVVWCIVVVCVF